MTSNNKRWVKIGEGTGFGDLTLVIPDRKLPVGTRIEVHMTPRLGVPAAIFDLPIERLFVVPSGIELIDVFEEGGIGIATMRVVGYHPGRVSGISAVSALPALLVPAAGGFLAWVKAHWAAILLGVFLLGLILTSVVVWAELMEQFLEEVTPLMWLVAISTLGIGGYLLWRKKRKSHG